MKNAKKVLLTIIFLLGLALILAGISVWMFPQWADLPGGILLLIGVAFIAIAGVGGKIKDWVGLLFGEEKSKPSPTPGAQKIKPYYTSEHSQEMIDSEGSKQIMRGRGGSQTQEMTGSPDSEQRME